MGFSITLNIRLTLTALVAARFLQHLSCAKTDCQWYLISQLIPYMVQWIYLPQNSNRIDHSYHECSLPGMLCSHKHYWDYILFNGRGEGAESWRFSGVISMELQALL